MRTPMSLVLVAACCSAAHAADVSEITKKLSSRDNEVRRAAAKELSELGKDAKNAIPALIKALRDEDRFVRRFAAMALGEIGPEARDAVGPLTKLLDDDKTQVREAAVKALAKLGPSAVPSLMKALNGTADVQEVAINALGEAGKDGIPGLTTALGNSKMPANLRRKALELLLPHKQDARTALPALTAIVKKQPPGGQQGNFLRLDAIAAVGQLAKASDKAAVAALDEIVKDEKQRNMQLKNSAKQALSRVQGKK